MTTTERISFFVGTAVALLSLVGSVWYAAVSFNNVSRSLDEYSVEMVWVREALENNTLKQTALLGTMEDHERRLINMERGYIEKVFVNHEFSIFRYEEGGQQRLIRVPSTRVES